MISLEKNKQPTRMSLMNELLNHTKMLISAFGLFPTGHKSKIYVK